MRGGKREGSGRPKGSINKAKKQIADLAKEYGPSALTVLNGIMKDEAAPSASRVSAANIILDRAYGKPIQATVEIDPDKVDLPFGGFEIHRAKKPN